MQVSDFKPGERVRYIPHHARGNQHHEDCEDGLVTSLGRESVFVCYDNKVRGTIDTIKKARLWTSAGTGPTQLVKL